MTGDDHTDALIAALRSSPLPRERAGEDAAISAMLGAMTSVPARPPRPRRRGVAIAAVTVASLGVGGLVAAGPGAFFAPAADLSPDVRTPPDRTPSVDPTDGDTVNETIHEGPDVPVGADSPRPVDAGTPEPSRPATPSTASAAGDDRIGDVAHTDACDEVTPDEATHGDVVSDEARSPEPRDVPDTARSDCGLPSAAAGDSPSVTALGRAGHDAADPLADPPLDRPADTPAETVPGRAGDAPSGTPSDTAPGRVDTGDARP